MKLNNTIELVGHGHPDRFADYIGEKILTECLKQDKKSKVAIEVLATRFSISLGGELTTQAKLNFTDLVHEAIDEVYGERWWPNFKEVEVFNQIAEQSPELTTIQQEGVVAGDQGVIYGYYNEERFRRINALYDLMDMVYESFDIAHDWKLLHNDKELSMSVCGDVDHSEIRQYVMDKIGEHFQFLIGEEEFDVIVNPKGKWLIPGPLADTGVVGRKLMIDTFGAGIPHGGGAFCGKDTSKVDKTGILWASKIATFFAPEDKSTGEVIVELNFKIGDELPKLFVNGLEVHQDVYETGTLNGFINYHDLNNQDWASMVKRGSVLTWLKNN